MTKKEALQEAKRRCSAVQLCKNCKFYETGKLMGDIDECQKFYAREIFNIEKDLPTPSPLADQTVRAFAGKSRTRLQKYIDSLTDAEIVALLYYGRRCDSCAAEEFCKDNHRESCMHVFCEYFKVDIKEVEELKE